MLTLTCVLQMGTVGDDLGIEFVVSVGDNFYETGLTGVDDPTFAVSFTDIYTAPSLQTTWYTGNINITSFYQGK